MTSLSGYSESAVLKDGTAVVVRAIRPGDAQGVLDAFRGADRDAIYRRFFTYKKDLSGAELAKITDVDFDRVVALVVTTSEGGRERLICGGRYAVSNPLDTIRSAEIAFFTDGAYGGRGIASLVLKHLIAIARAHGLRQLEATVLSGNAPMLSVLRRSGLKTTEALQGDAVELRFQL